MSKFYIFSLIYAVLGAIFFPILDSILMADKLGVLFLLCSTYILISFIWAILISSAQQFLVSSVPYVFLIWWISRDADQNMFGPGTMHIIFAGVVIYAVFALIWSAVKFFKKRFRR